MPHITAGDGNRIFYQFDGKEGAPVVLLSNSLGTTLEMWEPQLPALTGHYRVLRYDSRGHGRPMLRRVLTRSHNSAAMPWS